MTYVDPQKISDILIECAEQYILPRYKMLAAHEISSKTGPNDLVTQADLDVEAHLTKILPDLLPGSLIVGEEGVSSNPGLIDYLQETEQSVWVIDPVDGTHNFVHGRREFGVMMALVVQGQTVASWIYDVLGKQMTIAERGAGAFAAGKRISVAPPKSIENMIGHLNLKFFPKPHHDELKQKRKLFKSCHSLYCAAHEYLRVGSGDSDFALYNRSKSWDNLPGCLIVEEAGGYVAKWDGSPYKPQDMNAGIIAASSPEAWNIVFETILRGKI